MSTILHQFPMLRYPHAKRIVAQVSVYPPWPLRQREIWEHARLGFYPFTERGNVSACRVYSFDEMRLRIAHLIVEHGFPESADCRNTWPTGERVCIIEGVEVHLHARRDVPRQKVLDQESHLYEMSFSRKYVGDSVVLRGEGMISQTRPGWSGEVRSLASYCSR
jgi:hypothetical protein